MKKRVICFALSFFLYICCIVSSTPFHTNAVQAFLTYRDVNVSDWYYTYVSDLSGSGVISGYPDGTFRAGNPVTCGEALRLILRAAGYDEQTSAGGHWAGGFLQFALSMGYFTHEAVFDLNAAINRAMIAEIASKALNLPEPTIDTPFSDTNDSHVLSLYEAGIVSGSRKDNVLVYEPEKSITRAEISTVVWHIQNANAKPGRIQFGSRTLDVLKGVPVSSYNTSLFYMENGMMRYGNSDIHTSQGVDVSEYQGSIDWKKVAASGIDFAFIRVGYRGYTAGGIYPDKTYKTNLEGALAAGLDVGVYFFSQAISVKEAKEEAEFVLSCIKGYDISYPVVFDWETVNSSSARTNGLKTETLTQCAQVFSDTVSAAGYKPMVYFNSQLGYLGYDLRRLRGYDFWYAQYNSIPTFYYHFQMWQYTSKGKVNGIPGPVDMNISFKKYH